MFISTCARASRGEFAISFNGETMPNIDAGTSEASMNIPLTRRERRLLYPEVIFYDMYRTKCHRVVNNTHCLA